MRTRTIQRFVAASSLLGLLAAHFFAPAAAPQGPPPEYFVDEAKLAFDALPGTNTTRYWGILKGAGYRIEVPENWNGSLVLFAHGARNLGLPFAELTVTNPPLGMREYLVRNGFAWAASSYSKNLSDIQVGVQDTHALGEYFNGLVGHPARTYLWGQSMGGQIAAVAVEQYPQAYDGVYTTCGILGDREIISYYTSYHLVAQALVGLEGQFPEPDNYRTAVVPGIKATLGTPFPNVLTAKGVEFQGFVEQMSGGTRPFFPTAFRFWGNFVFDRGYGDGTRLVAVANAGSNTEAVYQSDADPALSLSEEQLNATVLRVEAEPQGAHPNGLANIPPIQGNPRVAVMTLHTIGDLQVPISMEQIYAQRVASNGKSHLLVQRAVRDLNHCGFVPAEATRAFGDLVTWVETGVKPEGDDFLDPAAVSSPDFGCRFTAVKRAALPACQ